MKLVHINYKCCSYGTGSGRNVFVHIAHKIKFQTPSLRKYAEKKFVCKISHKWLIFWKNNKFSKHLEVLKCECDRSLLFSFCFVFFCTILHLQSTAFMNEESKKKLSNVHYYVQLFSTFLDTFSRRQIVWQTDLHVLYKRKCAKKCLKTKHRHKRCNRNQQTHPTIAIKNICSYYLWAQMKIYHHLVPISPCLCLWLVSFEALAQDQ